MNDTVETGLSSPIINRAEEKRYSGWKGVSPREFFVELKRRHVYRIAIAYGVVAWLLIQIATQVLPFFEIPNWAVALSCFCSSLVSQWRWRWPGFLT
jgi:hypothetical protein